MEPWDYLICAAYVAFTVAVGIRTRRRHQSPADFLVANRSMRWWPIGISVMSAAFSATNFTGFSGEVAQYGLYVLLAIPALVLVTVPVLTYVIPWFHATRPVSVYAFLEDRFDRRVRQLAATLFILWRLLWMGTALYAAGRLMAGITGTSMGIWILIAGCTTTLYTALGGIRAVIWTDVGQFSILFLALAASLAVVSDMAGGLPRAWNTCLADGLLQPFYPFDSRILSLDPRVRISLWSCLIGGSVAFLGRYSVDQMVVQRYFTARSLRDARQGFLLNVGALIAALFLLSLLGLGVHAVAGLQHLPPLGPEASLARHIRLLPVGVAGLVIAALFAATMSDAGIHACMTSLRTDFGVFERVRTLWHISPDHLTLERLCVVLFGGITMVLASVVGHLGSVFEIANKVVNALGSPLLAVCLAGFVPRHLNARGVLLGGILGTLASTGVSLGVKGISLHHYATINLVITFSLCLLCSRLSAKRSAPIHE
jgi:SSS family transporter